MNLKNLGLEELSISEKHQIEAGMTFYYGWTGNGLLNIFLGMSTITGKIVEACGGDVAWKPYNV